MEDLLKPVKHRKGHANRKHGGMGTRLYGIWKQMRIRCRCKTNPSYRFYGARGIGVCEEWDDFSTFREWALANGYSDELTIERKNVNGNYAPDNCCWVEKAEQAKNTRNCKKYSFDGLTMGHNEWARHLGINPSSLTERIHRHGVETALAMGGRKHG